MNSARHTGADAHNGFKRHDRGALFAGLQSVQANSRSDHVELHRMIQHGSRGVAAMHNAALKTRILHCGDGFAKARALQSIIPAIGIVCCGKVRKHAIALDTAMEVDLAPKLEHVGKVHANPIHAGFDSHVVLAHAPHLHSALAIGKGEFGRVDRRHDLIFKQGIAGVDWRLVKNQNGRLDSALAQLNTLGNRGDREHVRTGSMHDLGALHGAVTVRISLDHTA